MYSLRTVLRRVSAERKGNCRARPKTRRVLIQSAATPYMVSLAPSFIANYDGVGIGAMQSALKKLGFADAGRNRYRRDDRKTRI